MNPSAAAILEGMPDPCLLHRAEREGTTWILAGSVVLACYPSADNGLRNVAGAVGPQAGFRRRAGAPGMGLARESAATAHKRGPRGGTARPGPPPGRHP